jgi:lanthanide-dependent methanol dehydrogenase
MRSAALVAVVLAIAGCDKATSSAPPTHPGPTSSTVAGTNPAPDDSGDWVRPARDYSSTRFSPLDLITTANVGQLSVKSTFSTGVLHGHEAAPIVVNNTMYVVTPWPNLVYALDPWHLELHRRKQRLPVLFDSRSLRGIRGTYPALRETW